MSPEQRDYCCRFQTLTLDFMRSHWDDMSCIQREACIEYQEYIEQLSLDELPPFPASENKYVNEKAVERYDKLKSSNAEYIGSLLEACDKVAEQIDEEFDSAEDLHQIRNERVFMIIIWAYLKKNLNQYPPTRAFT
jgi:hypothetical protein